MFFLHECKSLALGAIILNKNLCFTIPAFLVSTLKKFSSCVLPSRSAAPDTFTFLASPTSRSPTEILNGELAMCFPIRFTDTTCSPTSRGVKDIPAKIALDWRTPLVVAIWEDSTNGWGGGEFWKICRIIRKS